MSALDYIVSELKKEIDEKKSAMLNYLDEKNYYRVVAEIRTMQKVIELIKDVSKKIEEN